MPQKSLEDIRDQLCKLFEDACKGSAMQTYNSETNMAKAAYLNSAAQVAQAIARIDEVAAANNAKLDVFKTPRP